MSKTTKVLMKINVCLKYLEIPCKNSYQKNKSQSFSPLKKIKIFKYLIINKNKNLILG